MIKKTKFLTLGTVVGLLTLIDVQAASFDCNKASSVQEKLICSSPTIGRLDEENAKLYVRLLEIAGDSTAREPYKKDQRRWLKAQRNRCNDANCLSLEIWQRSAMLRTSIERDGHKTTDIPEVADTAQTLQKLVLNEGMGSVSTSSAPRDTAMKAAKPMLEAKPPSEQLSASGWQVFYDANDGIKTWWKRAPDMDRNGWVFLLSRDTGPNASNDEISLPVQCETGQIDLLFGNGAETKWVRPAKGSGMEKVVAFACANQSKSTSATSPALEQRGAGTTLDDAQALTMQQIRLGRCAAKFGSDSNFTRAEQLMSLSDARELTRGTYVALLKQKLSDAPGAAQNWADACQALGLDGGGREVESYFQHRMTPYEASHPGVQIAGGTEAATRLVIHARARQQEEQRTVPSEDPVGVLQAAYFGASATCKAAYRASFLETMKQVRQMRGSAQGVAAYKDNPNNPLERNARSIAQSLLNGMRSNGCAARG